jgi:hypothetical protein
MDEEMRPAVGGSGSGYDEVLPSGRSGPAAFLARVRVARRRAARLEAALARSDHLRTGGPAVEERDRDHAAAAATNGTTVL